MEVLSEGNCKLRRQSILALIVDLRNEVKVCLPLIPVSVSAMQRRMFRQLWFMLLQKRKTEGRAAKLVKMAHSARASRLDADGTVRKVKFRLPAAPGQDKVRSSSLFGKIYF